MHFDDNGNGIDYSETFDIYSVIQNFNRETIIATDDNPNILFAAFSKIPEAYSKPNQASKIKLFAKIVNGIKL